MILGLNYAPEPVGIGPYTSGMAEALVGMGHEVRVITGQPYYPYWRIAPGYKALSYSLAMENGVRVTRVPHYIPGNPSGGKRVLHHISFALAAMFPAVHHAVRWRPDVVIGIAPSLIAAPVAWFSALVSKARSWLHIQDLEVDAAFATGLLASQGAIPSVARWFERFMLLGFDTVSAISPAMRQKVIDKGVRADQAVEFRNWADIDSIRPLEGPSLFRDSWGIPTPFVALYSGNIANKQGIEIVVEAASRLRHRRDLTFVICGEGPNRAKLERQTLDLPNVQFHDLQPKADLNELLGLATVHLLPQIAGAADLVLPSKLTNMLASGRPVVATAAPGTGLFAEMQGCGIVVPPGNAEDFADAISRLLDNADLAVTIGRSARRRAEGHWDKERILERFAAQLGELVRS